jgi:hypothetical protein
VLTTLCYVLTQSVFTAYLQPGTRGCRWTAAETVPGLADHPDLSSGLTLIAAAGWEIVSATSRSVGSYGWLTSEYVLTCRRSGQG